MQTFAQGEIYVRKVESLPEGLVPYTQKTPSGEWIISHSESGNHHVIPSDGVTVMERTKDVPVGVKILYAIVDAPSTLRQDAGGKPHEAHNLAPGMYEHRMAREYDPFSQQARRAAD